MNGTKNQNRVNSRMQLGVVVNLEWCRIRSAIPVDGDLPDLSGFRLDVCVGYTIEPEPQSGSAPFMGLLTGALAVSRVFAWLTPISRRDCGNSNAHSPVHRASSPDSVGVIGPAFTPGFLAITNAAPAPFTGLLAVSA